MTCTLAWEPGQSGSTMGYAMTHVDRGGRDWGSLGDFGDREG